MMIYAALEQYDSNSIIEIRNSPEIDGVVLGDFVCQKRMFKYAGYELLELASALQSAGKKIIIQTPMYLTDKVFDTVMTQLDYLLSKVQIEGIIVQDIGAADYLKSNYKDIPLIWSVMGYARTPVLNISTIDWYKKVGIDVFMCRNMSELQELQNIGVRTIGVEGCPMYLTVNRECYCKYEKNIYNSDCQRVCLKKEKITIPASKKMDSTLDGYFLGLRYPKEKHFSGTETNVYIIYGRNLSQVEKMIKVN